MLGQTYAATKFRSILLTATASMLVEYAMVVAGSLIAGNLVGPEGIAAVAIVQPVLLTVVFVGFLISGGTVILANYEVGRQDRKRANQYFSQGIILAGLAGGLITLGLLLLREPIFSGLDISPGVGALVREYFRWLVYLPPVQIFSVLLFMMIINEGGERLCLASSVAQAVGGIGLSLLLCRSMGMAGIALGTVLGTLFSVVVLCSFFRGRSNPLRFVWYLDGRAAARALKFGLAESMGYFSLAALGYFFIGFLLHRFDEDAVIVFSLVMNFTCLIVSGFDGVSQAMQPLLGIYRGENNLHGIRRTMAAAAWVTLAEGLVFTVLALAGAPWIPGLYGLEDPEVVRQATAALRLYALAPVFFCGATLVSDYLLYSDRVWPANLVIVVQLLALPLACGLPLAWPLGREGVWAGLALSAPLSLAAALLILRRCGRGLSFPLLLDREEQGRQFARDIPATPEAVMRLRDEAEEEMRRRGVERPRMLKVMLLIEEVAMQAIRRNGGRGFFLECTIFFRGRITLILRDNGRYGDGSANVAPEAGQELWAARIITAHPRTFSPTVGSNRSVFTL